MQREGVQSRRKKARMRARNGTGLLHRVQLRPQRAPGAGRGARGRLTQLSKLFEMSSELASRANRASSMLMDEYRPIAISTQFISLRPWGADLQPLPRHAPLGLRRRRLAARTLLAIAAPSLLSVWHPPESQHLAQPAHIWPFLLSSVPFRVWTMPMASSHQAVPCQWAGSACQDKPAAFCRAREQSFGDSRRYAGAERRFGRGAGLAARRRG